MQKDITATPADLVCSHCGRTLDECSFCDREGCARALCYRCVAVSLTSFMAQPHPHGG